MEYDENMLGNARPPSPPDSASKGGFKRRKTFTENSFDLSQEGGMGMEDEVQRVGGKRRMVDGARDSPGNSALMVQLDRLR
jgi:hypothetical protein